VTPQQVKKVLQRTPTTAESAPAAAAASAPKPQSVSYAAAANAKKPAATPVKDETAGKKLLSALQKGDGKKATTTAAPDAAAVAAKAATDEVQKKVEILKRRIGIPEKISAAVDESAAAPVEISSTIQGGPAPAPAAPKVLSNGTGVNILALAAGFSLSDIGNERTLLPASMSILNHPMLGVISYQAQHASGLHKSTLTAAPAPVVAPKSTPAPAAAIPATATVGPVSSAHRSTSAPRQHKAAAPTTHTKVTGILPRPAQPSASSAKPTGGPAAASGAKLVLNKDATRRIVSHELKPNVTVATTLAAAAGAKKDGASKEGTGTATPAPGATLLAALKSKVGPKESKITSSDVAPSAVAPETAAAATAPPSLPVPPAAKVSSAQKLADAKKAMKKISTEKEKGQKGQQKESGGAPVAAPASVPPVPAAADAAAADATAGVDIVAMLKKAKITASPAPAPAATAPAPAPGGSPAAAAKAATKKALAPKEAAKPKESSSKSIVSMLLNAKITADATAAAAATPTPSPAPAPAPAPAVAASASSATNPPPLPPATPAAAAFAPAPAKKKAPSSLVPSKLMLSKKA
jgi:hypothetical protein